MSRGKKLLGLLMAVGLSVGMSVTPVLAETTSILDEITDEETTEDFSEDTVYYPARSANLNFGSVKIQRVNSGELSIFGVIYHFFWRKKQMEATAHIRFLSILPKT